MPHDVYRLAQLSIALSGILLVLSAAKRKKALSLAVILSVPNVLSTVRLCQKSVRI